MSQIEWEDIRHEFEFDGTWRDIYVLEANVAMWQRILDGLKSCEYQTELLCDGEPASVPSSVEYIFELKDSHSWYLAVRTSSMQFNCHFFTTDEVEFDLDPREVKGQAELEDIFVFMRFIADITCADVILTPENFAQRPIFKALPRSIGVEYFP